MKKYKPSNYNYYKAIDGGYAVLNGVSGSMIQVDEEGREKLLQCSSDADEASFLVQNRFWVDEETNELDQIYLKNRLVVFDNSTYRLTILPTLNCNLACWYCYQDHINTKMTEEIVERCKKHISNLVEKAGIKLLLLDWFGGEPMMYFEEVVYPISLFAKKICKENGVSFQNSATTNGVLFRDSYMRKLQEIQLNDYQITLDGKKDIHDESRVPKSKKPTYNSIVSNIISLCESIDRIHVLLRINYTHKTIEGITEIIEDFPKHVRDKVNVSFQIVWQEKEGYNTVDKSIADIKRTFREAGFISPVGVSFNSGYNCYADRFHQAVINYNGEVYKCTARDFEEIERDGLLKEDGNIYWETKMHKRLAHPTFENETCKKCKYLPVCFGPCSQKVSEMDANNFQCNYNGIKTTVNSYIDNQLQMQLEEND